MTAVYRSKFAGRKIILATEEQIKADKNAYFNDNLIWFYFEDSPGVILCMLRESNQPLFDEYFELVKE